MPTALRGHGVAPGVSHAHAKRLALADTAPASVADLCRAVAQPADRVTLASKAVIAIEPLGPDTLLNLQLSGAVIVQEIMGGAMPARPRELTGVDILLYVP